MIKQTNKTLQKHRFWGSKTQKKHRFRGHHRVLSHLSPGKTSKVTRKSGKATLEIPGKLERT